MSDKKIKDFILDLLFPINCLGCGFEGKWLCEECLDKITRQKSQICLGCGGKNSSGRVCQKCRENWSLDGTLLVFNYDNKILQKAIKSLKYQFAFDIARELSELLYEFFLHQPISQDSPMIIPVPLHKKRWRERGFNQAELLAQEFSPKYQVVNNILLRSRYTSAQAKLKETERHENIKDAFMVKDASMVKNKKIVMIDDVITTGSTLNECARILKAAGAREVWGLALAKG
jgi:ComF family protein